jgi:hypothetical protein
LIVLVDVDNTISDARWRDPWLGNWELFYSQGAYDVPVLPVLRMVNAMSLCGDTIIHLTGRPERWRGLTLDWMIRHKVRTDGLIMRPDDDYSPTAELKIALARKLFGEDLPEAGVGLMIDDMEKVLEKFREAGVDTLLTGLGGSPCAPSI